MPKEEPKGLSTTPLRVQREEINELIRSLDVACLMEENYYKVIEDWLKALEWRRKHDQYIIPRDLGVLNKMEVLMSEEKIKIKKISLIYEPYRWVEVELSTGSRVIIEACHESWEQGGGTKEELYVTRPIAEKYNDFLHGEERGLFFTEEKQNENI